MDIDNRDVNENEEDKEDEIIELKEEVSKLKKMVEDTLMDVRILISELENPFQYLSKYAGKLPEFDDIKSEESLSKDNVSKISVEDKHHEISDSSSILPEMKNKNLGMLPGKNGSKEKNDQIFSYFSPYNFKSSLDSYVIYERALLVGDFLLKIFGKDAIHKMLHLFYRRGLISSDVYMIMLDVIENLIQGEEFLYIKNKVSPEDYMLALYLLNKINEINENSIFFILLILKKSYEQASINSSLPGDLSSLLKSIGRSLDKEGENNV